MGWYEVYLYKEFVSKFVHARLLSQGALGIHSMEWYIHYRVLTCSSVCNGGLVEGHQLVFER